MEIDDFFDQYSKLKEKELEEKVWELWLATYPHMTKENYVSYEEMLNKTKQVETVDNKQVGGVYVDQIMF